MGSTIGVSEAIVDYLFSSTTNSLSQYESLSNGALSRGIDRYTKKDYSGAATEFRRSLVLSPSSSNAAKTYEYLAKSYLQQDKTEEAIKIYKEAIRIFVSDDTFHLSLGDLYFKKGQLKEAEEEYTKAVRLNPTSADNRYSLGQIYLTNDRFREAEEQFVKVTQLAPASPTGFYGLGQLFRESGEYNDALAQLTKAVSMNKKFANAFLELGYTYADLGNTDMAQKQLEILNNLGASQASTLSGYMSQVANPKFSMVSSTNGFISTSGPGTKVGDMSADLASPGGTKDFTINFIFSKDMDKNSVQKIANWQIGRQYGNYKFNTYNFGGTNPATEIIPPFLPRTVVYDSAKRTAVVTFRITQNNSGTGTLDPSHIIFKFKGKDVYGKQMDTKADEYSGFSLII